MPISPAHIGPTLLIGAVAGKRLNMNAMILAALLIDIEVVWLGLADKPIYQWQLLSHGFLHTFAGATIFGTVSTGVYFLLLFSFRKNNDRRFRNIEALKELREVQKNQYHYSIKCVLMSSLIGVYSHISMDWLFYTDIRVFNFTSANIFHQDIKIVPLVYTFCIFCAVVGIGIHYYRNKNNKNFAYYTPNLYSLKFGRKYVFTMIIIIIYPFAQSTALIILYLMTSFIGMLTRSIPIAIILSATFAFYWFYMHPSLSRIFGQ